MTGARKKAGKSKKRKGYPGFYSLPTNAFHDVHFWADWVELLCVANVDGAVTGAAAIKRARALNEDLGQGPADDNAAAGSPAEENDKWTRYSEEWFAHLAMRAAKFGDAYPFEITPDHNELKLRASLTAVQKLYLVLLMASCLRCFPKEESDLTSSFELISFEAMKMLVPAGAEVHLFGANKLKKGKFSAKLWDNISLLATELMEELLVAEKHFAPQDKGDNGLDLVAWLKLDDGAPGMLAMFGQCACTKQWDSKQFSSSPSRWANTMSLRTHPLNSVFVPLCVRDCHANWHKPHDLSTDTLLLDRWRLIRLLRKGAGTMTALPAFASVDTFLAAKEKVA